jgi:large subunit ribosomal protein L10
VPTQAKTETIEAVKARLAGATSAVLTEYRGLTVQQLSDLRKQLKAASAEYRVVKNRLARIAVEGSPLAPLRPYLKGPTGVVIGRKDPAAVAKTLAAFTKANPALLVRVGVIDGQVLEPQALKAVADLPSRDALRAQLVGTVQGPLVALVSVLNAPLRELAYVLSERGKGAGNPPAGPATSESGPSESGASESAAFESDAPPAATPAPASSSNGQEPEAAAPPA